MMSKGVTFAEEWQDNYDEEIIDANENLTEANAEEIADSSNQEQVATAAASSSSSRAQQPQSSSSFGLICPNCGSKEIEQHDASGASVCTECGVVVEENAIVSSVEFVEGAGGASSMVGQFVSATSSKAYTGGSSGGRGGRYGFSRDSRETTLSNGRKRIQGVASRLRLQQRFVDTAHRFFTIAVEKNFVQGRRTTHVVAACLYIACRQEKSQHMLIDFSDALQVNVYTLGTCFLKFRRLLGLQLELIDPALYIYRFASHLDLDEKVNAVGLTAIRLVQRMRRDWILAGRRPAGVCAAALLIAARAHGFSRTHQDVTKILRVCGMTVTSRVKEFEMTPSANLTLEQFSTVELDSAADPPVFTRNRIKEARAKAIQEKNVELLTSGALDDNKPGKKASKWRQQPRINKNKVQMQKLYNSLENELKEAAGAGGNAGSSNNNNNHVATTSTQLVEEGGQSADNQQIVLRYETPFTEVHGPLAHMYPKGNNRRPLVLPNQALPEELELSTQPTEEKINLTQWKEEMPESAASEIDDLFRSDEEMAQKEAIFNSLNKDYLALQERKENERLSAEAASKDRENEEAAQVEGRARLFKKKKRRRGDAEDDDTGDEPTAEEALLAAVSSRKISRKINYDAMSAIFDEDGSFSTDLLDDSNETAAKEMEEMETIFL